MEDTSKKEDRCALCEINHPHPERVQFALKHKLDDETSLHLADLFKVLGDKTRIKLLSLLVVEKEMCVCDIAEALQMGQSAIFETRGNHDCHVILRGGKAPNYSAADVQSTCELLQKSGQHAQVMIDLSHANSSKQHARQIAVAEDVAAQIAGGDARITGVMIESHLEEGRQDIVEGQALRHGVSVTDACISFAQTVPVLRQLAAAVRARRERNTP